jgi:hypothetical protein
MSEQEVASILGPPIRKTEGWGTADGDHVPVVLPFYYGAVGGATIEINFYIRKVRDKRWIEPDSKQPQG